MKAIVIIDMLNDFVTGIFGSYNAQRIVPNIIESLKIAEFEINRPYEAWPEDYTNYFIENNKLISVIR